MTMPMPSSFALVWLRNDLRCYDNAAFHQAQQTGLPVVAVFITTPATWQLHQVAPIKQDLIRRRVKQLQLELAELHIPLLAVEGSDYAGCAEILQQLALQGAAAVFAQTEYEIRGFILPFYVGIVKFLPFKGRYFPSVGG